MTWSDKDIDKLFQDHAKPVMEFKESYWDEMEALLPVEEARKISYWKYFGVLVAASTLIAVALLYNRQPDTSEKAYSRTHFSIASINYKESNSKIDAQVQDLRSEKNFSTESNKISRSTDNKITVESDQKNESINQADKLDKDPRPHIYDQKIEEGTTLTIMQVEKSEIDALDSKKPVFAELRPDLIRSTDVLRQKKLQKKFYLEAFGGLGQSFISDGNSLTSNFGLGGGIFIPRNKISYSFGANILATRFKNFELNERSTYYTYYKTTYENVFDYKMLFTAQALIQTSYSTKIGMFEINVMPGYTFQSQMDYTYKVNETRVREDVIYGENKGYTPFSLQAGIGFRKKIFSFFEVGIRMQSELAQAIKFRNGELNETRLPINAQLTIRKTFKNR